MSAANLALPVTFKGPSIRVVGFPIDLISVKGNPRFVAVDSLILYDNVQSFGEYISYLMSKKATVTVQLQINGQTYTKEVLPNRLLVDFLRYDIGLTGTKEGCGVGVCGACTVLLDGKMISSCISFAVMVDGHQVTTIEGLAIGDELLAIQEAFSEQGGFQCGACTPGQVIAAHALLESTPNPTENEIKDWMMSNLCRCTGYYGIIESIKAAAKK